MTDAVAALLATYESEAAGRAYDESVTELAHALQCAELAIVAGAPDASVAAALLHDVGHLLGTGAAHRGTSVDDRHEATGARHLRYLFGPDVTGPIALHVAAKRYLCGTDPGYLGELSPGSVRSLARQGGPMTAAEAASFRGLPHWQAAVQLRRWDDAAKVAGAVTRPLEDHAKLLTRLAMNSAVPPRPTLEFRSDLN